MNLILYHCFIEGNAIKESPWNHVMLEILLLPGSDVNTQEQEGLIKFLHIVSCMDIIIPSYE